MTLAQPLLSDEEGYERSVEDVELLIAQSRITPRYIPGPRVLTDPGGRLADWADPELVARAEELMRRGL